METASITTPSRPSHGTTRKNTEDAFFRVFRVFLWRYLYAGQGDDPGGSLEDFYCELP